MVAIKNNMHNLQAGIQTATAKISRDSREFAGQVLNGVKIAVDLGINHKAQLNAEGRINSSIDSLYGKIGQGFGRAINFLEGSAADALKAPIATLSELEAVELNINSNDSPKVKAAKTAVNGLSSFHAGIVRKGDSISRHAAGTVHGLVRGALYPVHFAAKLLQIESAGALIQNSVAVAVAFAVRAVVLGLTQLGHIAPYALAAVAIGGTVVGLAALGHFVSPLAAAGIAAALVIAGQQLQIHVLGKKIDQLSQQIKRQQNAPTLLNRLHARLPERRTVAKAVVASLVLGAAGYLGYNHGDKALELAKPYAEAGYEFVANQAANAQARVASFFQEAQPVEQASTGWFS